MWDAGEFAGKPVRFTAEQLRFVANAYRLFPRGHDREGQRVVRRAVKSRPKGAGKSAEAKTLCVAEGLGPVQFDGWDAYGEPVGRPRSAPFIRVMATEETQSVTTVFGGVVEMLRKGLELHPRVFEGVDAGLTRVYLPGGGEMRPSTASSSSKDGGRETFVVVDEGHLWTSRELREAYRTVRRNLAKRPGAWIIECSTMFAPGEKSVMEEAWEYAQTERRQRRDWTFMWDHREGPTVEDLDDDDELSAALAEAYGDAAAVVPFVEIMAEMRDPTCDVAEGMRYFLNQRVAGEGRCMDPQVWADATDATKVVDGPVGLGFDGSLMRAKGDATALVAVTLAEPRHAVVLGWWERPEEECWDEVEACVEAAFSNLDVAMMYADRARWGVRIDAWAGRWGAKRVKTWPVSSPRRVGQAFKDLTDAVKTGRLTHDGDSRLAAHVRHAVKVPVNVLDAETGKPLWIPGKESHGTSKLIDGFYALGMAHTAAAEAHAAGYKPKRRGRLVTF